MRHTETLRAMGACREAREWAWQHKSRQAAWDACERGDWMLWYLGRCAGGPQSRSRKQLVLVACKCARLALKHVPKRESRPRKAIVTAERWAKGVPGVTLAEVRSAADAAAYADAADAADAAAYAAVASGADARRTTLGKCAAIVRKAVPKPPPYRRT